MYRKFTDGELRGQATIAYMPDEHAGWRVSSYSYVNRRNGRTSYVVRCHVEEASLNATVAPQTFEINFEPGTVVYDMFRATQYVAGGEGLDPAHALLDRGRSEEFVERTREEFGSLDPMDRVCDIEGRARSILMAERTALNFIQHMSGVATLTGRFVQIAEPYSVRIVDTRKTKPLLRKIEKYAVRCGGGYNHRFGLFDGVLIKDNHIAASGGVLKAIGSIRTDSRQQEISEISRSLKALARELSCPLVAISQLSRAVERRQDHRPQLSDLRESGAIEQDADLVLFIYRAEAYQILYDDEGNSLEGVAEIIIGKQRNGPTGTVKLAFIDDYARFENLSMYQDVEFGGE